MEVRRTVPVKLNVADSDADLLHETISEFLWAANYVVDYAWEGDYKTTSKAELQRKTYDDVRAETKLQAGLVQNARNKAADAVRSVVARWKQGHYAGKPHFSSPTLVYDKRCATFNDDHARSRPSKAASPLSTSFPTRAARRPTRSICSTTTTK